MPAKRKLVSHAAQLVRDTMVGNLRVRIAEVYPGISETAAYEKIKARTGISLSSMQRIMSGDTGPSIDTLADLAHHLGTTVSELLQERTEALPETRTPRPPYRPPSNTRLQRRRA